jgi:choline dehydrogenase
VLGKIKTRIVELRNATFDNVMMQTMKEFQVVPDHDINRAIIDNLFESPMAPVRQANVAGSPDQRINPFSALVEPLLMDPRYDVTVVDCAHVNRVVIENLVAVGVNVTVDGSSSFFIRAKKEVILTAGAINSPQILLLSGVGPCDDLAHLGLPCVRDLPVGKTLIDHTFTVTTAFVNNVLPPTEGALTNFFGFVKTEWSKKHEPNRGRDMQIVATSMGGSPFGLAGLIDIAAYEVARSIVKVMPRASFWGHLHGALHQIVKQFLSITGVADYFLRRMISISGVLNHSTSRGNITLQSSNPLDPPIINLGLLSHPDDMLRLVAITKRILKMYDEEPLKQHVWMLDFIGGTKSIVNATDAQIESYIRKMGNHVYHPVGTVPMGTNGVLNEDLQVKNVQRLRVADVSALPNSPSGNPMVAALLVGSKCADIISLVEKK